MCMNIERGKVSVGMISERVTILFLMELLFQYILLVRSLTAAESNEIGGLVEVKEEGKLSFLNNP
jgi:hypothetical protein